MKTQKIISIATCFLLFSFITSVQSCTKIEDLDSSVTDTTPVISKQKSTIRTKTEMFNLAKVKIDDVTKSSVETILDKKIAVFPLSIDSKTTKIYAVINYTDSTTALTTEYTYYPADVLVYIDNYVIDSTKREFKNMPEAFMAYLNEIASSVDYFSTNDKMINGSLIERTESSSVSTKNYPTPDDPDFRPPNPLNYKEEIISGSRVAYETIQSLTSTRWNQGYPFYTKFTNGIGGYNLVGCNALTIGQLFKYYQHPTSVDNETFYYQYMPNLPTADNLYTLSNFASPMLYKIAVKINTNFGVEESSATTENTINFASNYYNITSDNYGSGAISLSKETSILRELRNGRPFLLRGDNSEQKGHIWIVDGYQRYRYENSVRFTFYNNDGSIYSIFVQVVPQQMDSYFYLYHNFRQYESYLDPSSSGYRTISIASTSIIANGNSNYNSNKFAYYCVKK